MLDFTQPESFSPNTYLKKNQKRIFSIIKEVTGHAYILTAPQLFVDLTGDLTLAAMLSQLIYWSDRSIRPDGFVYKSAIDWKNEVGASKRSVQKFNQLPYIETKIRRANGHPTTHYKVRFDVLIDQIYQLCQVYKPGIDPLLIDERKA